MTVRIKHDNIALPGSIVTNVWGLSLANCTHLLILLSDVRCNRLCRNICAITMWTYLTSVVCTSAGQEDNLCLIPDLILFMPSLPHNKTSLQLLSSSIPCLPLYCVDIPTLLFLLLPVPHHLPLLCFIGHHAILLRPIAPFNLHHSHPTLPYHPPYLCSSGHVKFAAMYKLWHVFQYKEGMFTDE